MKISDPRHDLENARVISWAAVSTRIQDKYSIEDQLKLEREWIAKHGAKHVDELVVRGFSRDYWTLSDVVTAAKRDPDMEAFAKLQEHIRKRSFTVFLCFDADRFGRTQSLVHEVIGRITRDCDALIYTLFDGVWMDAESAPTIGTFKAYKAQNDIDRLRGYRATGMLNRAREGKSTTSHIPIFQKRIRDELGKEVALVINEDLRPLWTDLATLILQGVPWSVIEKELFEEFGHGNNGRPYFPDQLRRAVISPAWWGHSAIHFRGIRGESVVTSDPWIWDETIDPPPHVTIFRNCLPPVYGGKWQELGEQVKAELWRRYSLRGKARPAETFRFHGLLVCDECGYRLTASRGDRRYNKVYVRCPTAYDKRWQIRRDMFCSQHNSITDSEIEAFLTTHIRNKTANLPTWVFDDEGRDRNTKQLDQEKHRLKRLNEKLDALVDELTSTHEKARPTFRKKIEATSAEITLVEKIIHELESDLTSALEAQNGKMEAFHTVKENGGTDWLWRQGGTLIHQLIHAMLGGMVLVVRDGKIKGAVPAPKNQLIRWRGTSQKPSGL